MRTASWQSTDRATPSARSRGPTTPSPWVAARGTVTGTWSAVAAVRDPSASTRVTDVGAVPVPSRTVSVAASSPARDHNGLDRRRAVREARGNEHHHSMLRSSCAGLMEFLGSAGLLTPAARAVYRRAHLL